MEMTTDVAADRLRPLAQATKSVKEGAETVEGPVEVPDLAGRA